MRLPQQRLHAVPEMRGILTMLFLFYIIGWVAAGIGAICGPIGYVWKEARWVYSVGDYLRNLAWMIFQVAWGIGIVWLYTTLFGWPEPD